MTKTRSITCFVIALLALASALIFSADGNKDVKTTMSLSKSAKAMPQDTNCDLSFCNEALPVNDDAVNRKLQHSLQKHDYKTIQSNILQTKAIKLFPIIEPILKAYGIPNDFKYMPLVESGLDGGTSSKGARGVWQLMPGTARILGLRVGHKGDERLSVEKSTVAACKHLRSLYAEFNSWTLAAAAYNDGDGKISRAINKQNEDNYFRMRLNHETGTYVYKLVAMKQIISYPERYGYKTFSKPQQLMAYN
jgi:membrane-bound lytic murein transglycosylase MltF